MNCCGLASNAILLTILSCIFGGVFSETNSNQEHTASNGRANDEMTSIQWEADTDKLRYYRGISLEVLRNITRTLSEDSQLPSED